MAEAVTLREDATPLRDDVAHFGAKARALAPVRRLLLASATPSPAPATRVGVSRSRLAVSATPSSSCASTSRRTSSATSGPTVAAAQPVQRTPTAVTVTTALRTSGISFIQHTPVAGSRGHTLAARFLSSTPLATRAASKPPAFALCAAPACAADEFTYSSSCLTRVPNPSDAACVTSTMQAQPGRMPFSAPGEDSTAEPTATETLPDVTVSDAGNESSAALATVFQECQQYGRAEVLLQLLLEAGASDKRLACGLPSDAVSPLGAAASAGFLDLVQLLIDYGAPVHATPGQKAPLALAAAAGRVHTAALLLSHGADPDEAGTRLGGDYRTPLMLAAARGDVAMVALLLDGGASINCSIGGVTAVYVAAHAGRQRALDLLLQRGACADTVETGSGASPLYIAAWHGHLAAVDALAQAAPGLVDCANRVGITPVHAAVLNNRLAVVKYLLMVGADASVVTSDGTRLIDVATAYGHKAIATLLAQPVA